MMALLDWGSWLFLAALVAATVSLAYLARAADHE